MRVQQGKKTIEISQEDFATAVSAFKQVLLDIGTGDGRFVYRWALKNPDTFCIGLDALGDRLQEVSGKALRKPAKGGAPNAMYVVGAVESLPVELHGVADTITINYPWGSLLAALVTPNEQVLAAIAALAKPDAGVTALINYSVFKDPEYVARLGLAGLTEEFVEEVLKPKYRSAGIEIEQYKFLNKEVPHRTSWGQTLTLGGGRETLLIEGKVRFASATECL